MSIKIIYFPHSTSLDNINKISSGWKDVSLSELGLKQANNLKEILKDKKFDLVFTSDLKRAVQTSEIVFEDKTVIKDSRLRECCYGVYDGKSSEIVEPLQEEHIFKRFPSGESYEDVRVRILDFLEFLKKEHPNKTIAIISHKAPQLALDVILKKMSWKEAFEKDWRKKKEWIPGWEYILD